MASISWTDDARRDLRETVAYISRDSAAYSAAVGQRIAAAIERLRRYPRLGRVVPEYADETVRELIVGNYRVIYRVRGQRVGIVDGVPREARLAEATRAGAVGFRLRSGSSGGRSPTLTGSDRKSIRAGSRTRWVTASRRGGGYASGDLKKPGAGSDFLIVTIHRFISIDQDPNIGFFSSSWGRSARSGSIYWKDISWMTVKTDGHGYRPVVDSSKNIGCNELQIKCHGDRYPTTIAIGLLHLRGSKLSVSAWRIDSPGSGLRRWTAARPARR